LLTSPKVEPATFSDFQTFSTNSVFLNDDYGNFYNWNPEGQKLNDKYGPIADWSIVSTALTHSRKLLLLGLKFGHLQIFDFFRKETTYKHGKIHDTDISSIQITSDDSSAFTTSLSGELKEISLTTNKVLQSSSNLHPSISTMLLTPNNKYLLLASHHPPTLHQIPTLNITKTHHNYGQIHTSPITKMALTSDSKYLFTNSSDGTLKQISLKKKLILRTISDLFYDGLDTLRVTPDNDWLLVTGQNGM
jgi:WD40 repeat protein